ncbi:MAG: hypothetical protein K1X74_06330 [Pirellulales bacterium]|nr:hypothetical protein [Pirellulales bacterium]
MYFVQCPQCGAKVEIPDDAVGPDRTDLYNIAGCLDCDTGFDYWDDEVQFEPDPTESA